MRTYDFSPLWRSTIGFDRLFDLAETAQRAGEDNYPPYNIERLGDDRYQISLAVAGFSPDEISVTAEQNVVKSAAFENGLLKIELFREIPEAMKPRRISINGGPVSNVHQLEGKAA
jgi:molecular chaperone IbpA